MAEIHVEIKQQAIGVTFKRASIVVTMSGATTWNHVGGKPTATEQNSFMVSGATPFPWEVKTKAETLALLGVDTDIIDFTLVNSYRI